ncbi:hypothetical protein C8F01DRAFT_1329297 [Mycena amicta]|nr:hypothetical protein C8F01DRAFT_1329297 [Mycena amicta]
MSSRGRSSDRQSSSSRRTSHSSPPRHQSSSSHHRSSRSPSPRRRSSRSRSPRRRPSPHRQRRQSRSPLRPRLVDNTGKSTGKTVTRKEESVQQLGRGIRKAAVLFGDIQLHVVDALEYERAPFDDLDFSPSTPDLTVEEKAMLAEKRKCERGYEAYLQISRLVAGVKDKIGPGGKRKDLLCREKLQKGANDALSEDVLRVTKRVAEYINANLSKRHSTMKKFDYTPSTIETRGDREVEVAGRAPILNPNTRSGRGLAHDVTGGLSSSIAHDWEDESIRVSLRNNTLLLAPNFYARVFYKDYEGDPRKVELGFLKSPLLVNVWLAIFMASSSDADGENVPPTRTPEDTSSTIRKTVAELLWFNGRVPARSIAYAAVLLYFALSDCSKWRPKFHGVDLPDMYNFFVDFFEDTVPGSKARKRVDALLAWWTKTVYSTDACSGMMTESAAASTDDLWAQRAMMEEEDSDGEQS